MGKAILLGLIFLVVAGTVAAMPVVVTEEGIENKDAMIIVNSIPKEYYKYADVIEFTREPVRGQKGYASARWNTNHYCTYAKVEVYWNLPIRDTLIHELGHIYELCELKKDKTTEEFADEFGEAYGIV